MPVPSIFGTALARKERPLPLPHFIQFHQGRSDHCAFRTRHGLNEEGTPRYPPGCAFPNCMYGCRMRNRRSNPRGPGGRPFVPSIFGEIGWPRCVDLFIVDTSSMSMVIEYTFPVAGSPLVGRLCVLLERPRPHGIPRYCTA
jgi:hypothetical protein